MRFWNAFVSASALVLVVNAAGFAQGAPAARFTRDTTRAVHAWTPVRVAKWTVLAGSTAAVVYGFRQNRSADREYTAIEQLCKDNMAACARTSEKGPYTDAALEARYQAVVQRDSHAHTALLAGQLGIGASIVLFILDLPKNAAPQDIPYQPRSLRFGAEAGGFTVAYGLTFR